MNTTAAQPARRPGPQYRPVRPHPARSEWDTRAFDARYSSTEISVEEYLELAAAFEVLF